MNVSVTRMNGSLRWFQLYLKLYLLKKFETLFSTLSCIVRIKVLINDHINNNHVIIYVTLVLTGFMNITLMIPLLLNKVSNAKNHIQEYDR